MLHGSTRRFILEEPQLEPVQGHSQIGQPLLSCRVGRSTNRVRQDTFQPAIPLQRLQTTHEPLRILRLKSAVDETVENREIGRFGIPNEIGRRIVHPVEQAVAGAQDALAVAPGECGSQEARDGDIVPVAVPMGNPQRILFEKTRSFIAVSGLIQHFPPLRQRGLWGSPPAGWLAALTSVGHEGGIRSVGR